MIRLVVTIVACISFVYGTETSNVLNSGRIVGGAPTTIQYFPWQVSLTYYGNHRCGGSIVNENFIVTAAHCTYNTNKNQLGVRSGTSSRNAGGITSTIRRSYEHPKYNERSIDFDISVIWVTVPFKFGYTVQPIQLPEQNEQIAVGTRSWVTGWGDTSESGASVTQTLHYTNIPIMDNRVCATAFKRHTVITDNMICAGYYKIGGRDACQGDSGGPLMADNKLVGIVSFGIGCARPNYPGVYTRVGAFRNWIDNLISQS